MESEAALRGRSASYRRGDDVDPAQLLEGVGAIPERTGALSDEEGESEQQPPMKKGDALSALALVQQLAKRLYAGVHRKPTKQPIPDKPESGSEDELATAVPAATTSASVSLLPSLRRSADVSQPVTGSSSMNAVARIEMEQVLRENPVSLDSTTNHHHLVGPQLDRSIKASVVSSLNLHSRAVSLLRPLTKENIQDPTPSYVNPTPFSASSFRPKMPPRNGSYSSTSFLNSSSPNRLKRMASLSSSMGSAHHHAHQ